jgi:hypothetical protein
MQGVSQKWKAENSECAREYNRAYLREYNRSPLGWEAHWRYNHSPKGQERNFQYDHSPKGQERGFRRHEKLNVARECK